jgi:hypothetical protein
LGSGFFFWQLVLFDELRVGSWQWHLGSRPGSRRDPVSPVFDLLVGAASTKWVLLEVDAHVPSLGDRGLARTSVFTAMDADFQCHVVGSSVVI